VTLVRYVPGAGPVHRLPAGIKLLCLAALAVLLFARPRSASAGAALAGTLVVGLGVARLPAAVLARQAWALRWFLLALLVVHALTTDVASGAHTVLRLLTLVLAAAVVTATTRVTEMVAVVEWLCAPLRLVGGRPQRVGLLIAMALRFIPVLVERADRIRAAPLLVQLLQMAHDVSEALDARGADDVPAHRPRRA
jgi:biotin transport system permease protein